MNGFANAILSLLLSWIRVIIAQFWKLFTSDTGEKLFSFFSKNWLLLLIILCAAGLVIDLVIYFLRWRPDQVWRSRRLKKEEEWLAEEEEIQVRQQPSSPATGFQWEQDYGYYPDDNAVQRGTNSAGYATAGFQPVRGKRALDVVEQQVAPYVQPAPQTAVYAPATNQPVQTAVFSPVASQPSPVTTYQSIVPTQPTSAPESAADFDPVFDEAPLNWNDGDTIFAKAVPEQEKTMPASYPTPLARSDSYFQDMQAGYAPALTPQQMYAPNVPGPEASAGPVHPGLDAESLRKNIGLSPAGSLADQQEEVYKINTNPMGNAPAQARSKNRLSALARKALDFMGTDENAEPSIYDLQPTVDMNNAFHEPVYPQPRLNREDD
ncbi:MAG: hypothetical protein E7331_10215 [Clostridiales bacterium]|nr:hypothetical protein [Clostridiales bacterium]